MDYSISNTTKKQRMEIVKKAFAISISANEMPSDKALQLAKEYVDGITELEEVQKKIVNLYQKGK